MSVPCADLVELLQKSYLVLKEKREQIAQLELELQVTGCIATVAFEGF